MEINEITHQENLEKLRERNLHFSWTLDIKKDPLADVDISTLEGRPVISAQVDKRSIIQWLAENIDQAICMTKYLIIEKDSGEEWFLRKPEKKRSFSELLSFYDKLQNDAIEDMANTDRLSKLNYRQLITGKLSEHLSPELSRKLADEIIEFGEILMVNGGKIVLPKIDKLGLTGNSFQHVYFLTDYKCSFCKDEGWVHTNGGLTDSPCPMNCKQKKRIPIEDSKRKKKNH